MGLSKFGSERIVELDPLGVCLGHDWRLGKSRWKFDASCLLYLMPYCTLRYFIMLTKRGRLIDKKVQ